MRNRTFLLCSLSAVLGMVSCQQKKTTKFPLANPSYGQITRIEAFKSAFVDSRDIDIWVPTNYNSAEHLNVIYLHDGQMLFDSTISWNGQEWMVDEVIHELIEDNAIPSTIVVGIHNTPKRRAEYFPKKVFDELPENAQLAFLRHAGFGGTIKDANDFIQSDNYLRFIIHELKPFIDSTFATYSDSDHTFIGGSSMGGLISLYALCEYPDVFGGAMCMSTHWTGTFTDENNPIPNKLNAYLRSKSAGLRHNRLYLDIGSETLDSLYDLPQQKIIETLSQSSMDSSNWMTLFFPGDDHSERSWSSRLKHPLTFLLAGQKPKSIYASTELYLSEDSTHILNHGKIILDTRSAQIEDWFKTKSGLFDSRSYDSTSRVWFQSLHPARNLIGFELSTEALLPDKVVGVYNPKTAKLTFLTGYYLGNEFKGFSPNGRYFIYQNSCWEGLCGLTVKSSVSLETVAEINNPEYLDYRETNVSFGRWINDSSFTYVRRDSVFTCSFEK